MTAVEWLKKELEDYGSSSHLNLDWPTFDELCEQAKQVEKEQIIKAYTEGLTPQVYKTQESKAEEYYNETHEK